jgi:putative capsular polysaccharide synthesis protein
MGFRALIPDSALIPIEPECNRLIHWLKHFDLHFYRTHAHYNGVADLEALNDTELLKHFVETGWLEKRSYSGFILTFLEPDFYRNRYPELALKDTDEATRHWMYEGFYEGRIPNSVTNDLLESDIHLFQFGKVGSKSIEAALYAGGYQKLVPHLHWPNQIITTYPNCIFSYEEIVNFSPRKRLSFISGVRDPFERMISGYFQTNLGDNGGEPSEETVHAINAKVLEDFFGREQISLILDWFDHKFFRDVDVFAQEFDKRAGYVAIEKNDARVFLYRLDKFSSLEQPLTEFTGMNIRLERTNVAVNKAYSRLYAAVMASLRFPAERVNRVLSSRLVTHFYTEPEIERMRERWTAK